MADTLVANEIRPREPLTVQIEQLVVRGVNFHRQFEQERWQGRGPSFHNAEGHVLPILSAVDAMFAGVERRVDSLHLNDSLAQWNQIHAPQNPFTMEDLHLAFRLAFAFHDTGNLTLDAALNENGVLSFADIYLRENAEDRSVGIAQSAMDRFLTPASENERAKLPTLQSLVSELIDNTKFAFGQEPPQDLPFWQAVQVFDQISPYYLSNKPYLEQVIGLLNEWSVRGEAEQNLKNWVAFGVNQFRALVPEDGQREGILSVFDPTGQKRLAIQNAATPPNLEQMNSKFPYPTAIQMLQDLGGNGRAT